MRLNQCLEQYISSALKLSEEERLAISEALQQSINGQTAEPSAIQLGIEALETGSQRRFDQFDREFRAANGNAPRS